MKKITILGASGSIGIQALNIIRNNNDKYLLHKITVGKNIKVLKDILNEFTTIEKVGLLENDQLVLLQNEYPHIEFTLNILDVIDQDDDLILNAIVGFAGVLPSIKVIELNKTLALANKETMVVAGEIVNDLLIKHPQASIIPVDSEHCALFQCLLNNDINSVKRLIISASGGSFRDKTLDELKNVSIEDALNHPNWDMGASITIDSATMLNKGLEVIEAHYLFKIPYDLIEVVIHRESIIHSMVEYQDSCSMAQLSNPNMEQPIAYAFAYPKRANYLESSLDLTTKMNLTFEPVDYTRFEGLALAYQAGRLGHSYPCVLNASKEIATNAFLNKQISFLQITELVKDALTNHKIFNNPSLKQLVLIDAATRKRLQYH